MARRKKVVETEHEVVSNVSSRPAITPEAREKQLVALAVDLAEQQLRDGTASSQVITHFLKIGSMREQEELEKLKNENALLKAKTDAIESAQRTEEMYANALAAMKSYSTTIDNGDDQDVEVADL